MIHGHGDDLYRSSQMVKANFSTNVWYGADANLLCKLLEKSMDKVLHYPEPDAGEFVKVAAAYHGLRPENILAGNGATELFYLIAHAFAGGRTVIPVPSFTEYEDACGLYEHELLFVSPLDIEAIPEDVRLMFLCNPNNPDGSIWREEEIARILHNNPDLTLVVDESFIHFAPEIGSACGLLEQYPNLLVVRSMTKSYAMPGLRLGYMLGNPELIKYIAGFKQPWSVNALAIEAGKYFLEQGTAFLPDASDLLGRQKYFSSEIAKIPGFCPLESHTSFFLVRTRYDSVSLKEYLLEKHGLLIRDASNFRGLDHHYFRVNTLPDEKNRLLTDALSAYES